MGAAGTSATAMFVDGQYLIGPSVSGRRATVAANHEEAHGLIRRSTPYGILLSQMHAAAARDPDVASAAHELSSRARTSEEVFATFSSINSAIWAGYRDAESTELGEFSEYRYYYNLGVGLTAGIDVRWLRNVFLEGAVRFCWSSIEIADFLRDDRTHADVAQLSTLAFPDSRFKRLCTEWTPACAAAWVQTIEARFPYVVALRNLSFAELFDPLHQFKSQLDTQSTIWMDPELQLGQLQTARATTWAVQSEGLVGFVADRLADRYAGTPMAAPQTAEVQNLIKAKRPDMLGKPRDVVGTGIIENAQNLVQRRRAQTQATVEWDARYELPIVGWRSWRSFVDNFHFTEAMRAPPPDDGEAIYAIAHSLIARALSSCVAPEDLTLALHPGFQSEAPVPLSEWMQAPVIVAAWSSLVARDHESWIFNVHKLNRAGFKVWMVVDTEPQQFVRMMRSQLGEVNGFHHAPCRDRPHIGALVVRCLERSDHPPCALRGLVFPGRDHTLKIILNMLRTEMTDDFRGFGTSIELHAESRAKRLEGQALVEWLMNNEFIFTFARK